MTTVDAVSLKLPTFWNTSPAAWFAQADAQFHIRGITTEETKYYYVVSALDSETATRVLPILTSPPTDNKYSAIKDYLLSVYDLSEYERAAALFNLSGLGDSKPSTLMDHMLSLLGSHAPCFLFRHLFLQQLPNFVRTPLASSSTTDYRALALEADKLYLAGSSNNIQEVSHAAAKHSSNKPENLCWYHHRFSKSAKKCLPGCKYYPTFNRKQGNEQQGQC